MLNLKNKSIYIKSLIAPAILIISIILIASLSIFNIKKQRSILQANSQILVNKITLLDELLLTTEIIQSKVYQTSLASYMKKTDEETNIIQNNIEQKISELNILFKRISYDWKIDGKERKIIQKLEPPKIRFVTNALGAAQIVRKNPSFGVALVRSSARPYIEFSTYLKEYIKYQKATIKKNEIDSKKKAELVIYGISIFASVIIIISLLISIYISIFQISKPIKNLTETILKIAGGDWETNVFCENRKDEIGKIMNATEVFKQSLIENYSLKERLLQAQKLSHVGYWDWETGKNKLTWSDEVYKIFGRKSENFEVTIESFESMVHPDDFSAFIEERNLAIANHRGIDIEHRIILPNGNERYVHELSTLVKNTEGRIVKVIGTVQDITDTKNNELELIRYKTDLEKIIKERTDDLNQTNESLKAEISRRKTVEDLLTKSQQRLVDAIETLDHGFVLWDANDRLVLCNHIYKEIYKESAEFIYPGVTFKEIIQKGAEKGQYKEAVGRKTEWIKERLQHHRQSNKTIEQQLGNGKWVRISERKLSNGDIVGLRIDITTYKQTQIELENARNDLEGLVENRTHQLKETNLKLLNEIKSRKKIEDQLKTKNEYLSTIHSISMGLFGRMDLNELLNDIIIRASNLTNIPDIFFHLFDSENKKLVIKAASGNFSKLIGYSINPTAGFAGQVFSKGTPLIVDDYSKWADRLSDPSFDFAHAMVGVPLTVGDEIVGVLGLSHTDPTKKVKRTLIPVLEQFSEIVSLAIYNVELFEQVERELKNRIIIEKERREIEAKLSQSQRIESIGTLAGGIAHDFNNILSAILGFGELAQSQVIKGSDLEEDIQEIISAGKRAKDLVKQILTFARRSDEHLKQIQIKPIAKEVIKFIRSSIPSTIEIVSHINTDAFIFGNPSQLHQVLMNLCTNASHAMENGGILQLEIEEFYTENQSELKKFDLKSITYIRIQISDTGVGIDEDIIDSIFDPYFTTKKIGEGSGIGLSVVHGIVESYQGKIFVTSKVGKGSVFTIFLPVVDTQDNREEQQEKRMQKGKGKILFIDDEIPITKMTKRFLDSLGYSVTAFNDGIEGLDSFKKDPHFFDLVITDMTMPKITGDQIVHELLLIRPDIPILICTGFSIKINTEKAIAIGAKGLITKPIIQTDMAEKISDILKKNNCKR